MAAHLLLPVIVPVINELRSDAEQIAKERDRPKQNHDADADWAEYAAKAEGRYQGASRVAAMIQAVARG